MASPLKLTRGRLALVKFLPKGSLAETTQNPCLQPWLDMVPKLHLLLTYRAFDTEHVTYSNEGDISALMLHRILVLVQLRICGFPDRLTSVDSLRSFLTSVDSLRSFLTSVD